MAGPWEKYGGQQQSGQMVTLPPDPIQQAAQVREERRLQLAEEAARRAAANANRPNLPAGWRMGANGVAERIPGLPSTNEASTPRTSAKERSTAIQGYTDASALERIADDLEAKFKAGPGGTKGIRGLQDYLPTAPNKTFNDTAFQARGLVKRALGFTGGEGNTIGEIQLNYGPYLPEAGDYDQQIENKIAALRKLANDSRSRSVAVLGGIPDANGNVTPVKPGVVSTGNMQTGNGNTQDKLDPETSQQVDLLVRANRSDEEIAAFLKSRNYPMPPKGELDAWRQFLQANPDYKGGSTQAIERTPVGGMSNALGVDPSSGLGAYGAASANTLMAGTLDEFAGGNAQQAKELLRQQHPGASLAGDITGSALGMTGVNAGLRGLGGKAAQLATRGGGIGGDMLYGSAFGAGESNDDRLTGAVFGGGAAAAGNLAGRGIVNALGKPLTGIRNEAVNYLADRGVRMTPGQMLGQGGMLGKGYRAAEDAFESIPFVGSAIRSRKNDGLQDFNRLAFKDGLAPIGQQVEGQIGQEAIGEAQDLVSDAYGNALSGVNMRPDMPFVQQAGQAIRSGRKVPEFGADVDYLARENLGPAFGPNRTLNGEGFQSSLQDIAATAGDFRKAGNVRGRNANKSMQDLRQAYFGLADRQAPGATSGLQSANSANRNVSILEDSVNNAVNNSVESGMFTPAGLGRFSVNNTKKFGGKKAAARGDYPFAELTQHGQQVLPNVVPNSGTVDRAMANAVLPAALGGAAAGANYFDLPAPVTGGLAALSVASSKGGNTVLQKLLTSRSPEMRKLGEDILKQSRRGGMFGGAAAAPMVVGPY